GGALRGSIGAVSPPLHQQRRRAEGSCDRGHERCDNSIVLPTTDGREIRLRRITPGVVEGQLPEIFDDDPPIDHADASLRPGRLQNCCARPWKRCIATAPSKDFPRRVRACALTGRRRALRFWE